MKVDSREDIGIRIHFGFLRGSRSCGYRTDSKEENTIGDLERGV